MNRRVFHPAHIITRIPHARGDEPNTAATLRGTRNVFPTHVGMNRLTVTPPEAPRGIPHARGDEPIVYPSPEPQGKYSPRTWG